MVERTEDRSGGINGDGVVPLRAPHRAGAQRLLAFAEPPGGGLIELGLLARLAVRRGLGGETI
jgi:hypothetical protein